MLAAGQTGADIARRFGIELSATYNGLKRYGLSIDPEATLKARTASCVVMATRPDIRAKRARHQKRLMNDPERREKYRQIMLARHKADPTLIQRAVEGSRAPEVNARRSKSARKRWAEKRPWLPEPFCGEYRRLLRSKNMRAEEAKAALLPEITKWLASFEGQMWRVQTGKARIVEVAPIPRAQFDHSLTGCSLAQ